MENCIFCKIIRGEIPSYKIYEDEFTFAFLDIAGDYYGHTLVVPKTHADSIVLADNETINHCLNAVKKISKHYIDDCGFGGVQVFNNCNECAGQSVMHLHFHIVPRNPGDKLDLLGEREKTDFNYAEIVNKLKF